MMRCAMCDRTPVFNGFCKHHFIEGTAALERAKHEPYWRDQVARELDEKMTCSCEFYAQFVTDNFDPGTTAPICEKHHAIEIAKGQHES